MGTDAKYVVRLSVSERVELDALLANPRVAKDRSLRARMLLKTDADGPAWPDSQIAEAFDVAILTVARLRQRCVCWKDSRRHWLLVSKLGAGHGLVISEDGRKKEKLLKKRKRRCVFHTSFWLWLRRLKTSAFQENFPRGFWHSSFCQPFGMKPKHLTWSESLGTQSICSCHWRNP